MTYQLINIKIKISQNTHTHIYINSNISNQKYYKRIKISNIYIKPKTYQLINIKIKKFPKYTHTYISIQIYPTKNITHA